MDNGQRDEKHRTDQNRSELIRTDVNVSDISWAWNVVQIAEHLWKESQSHCVLSHGLIQYSLAVSTGGRGEVAPPSGRSRLLTSVTSSNMKETARSFLRKQLNQNNRQLVVQQVWGGGGRGLGAGGEG